MSNASSKQKWFERETVRVHEIIERQTDEFLSKVDATYQRLFTVLETEVKKLKRDLDKGRISSDYMELRTNALISQLESRIRELNLDFAQELAPMLETWEQYSREGMQKILSKMNTIYLPTTSIEFEALYGYDKYTFQSSINKAGIKLGTKLNDVMTEGLAKGWDSRKYSKEIQKLADFTKFEANRIGRTESARVATEGSRRAMKEYGIERVRWSASLERRTCLICAGLNGKKFILGQEPPLPRHPFCRCVLIPVVE